MKALKTKFAAGTVKQAPVAGKMSAPPVAVPKSSLAAGRNPHAGKAVDQSGSVAGWQHGHYDYEGS